MATRREIVDTEFPDVQDSEYCVVRIRQADLAQLEKHLFQRYPYREWGTFFRFGFRRTSWGIAICFVDGLWPQAGELNRQSDLTHFHEDYARRAFHAAANSEGLAVGVIHSHPVGCHVSPSELDDDMDSYFGQEVSSFSSGNPYCSLILERSDRGGLTFSGRVFDRGRWLPVHALISVGQQIDRWQSNLLPIDERIQESYEESTTDRLQAIMGAPSKERLAKAVVGVIGCSGTGSPAIEVLARAGVGEFILLDPDKLSPSNLERVHGSEYRHLQFEQMPFKVALMRELILSINPNAKITALAGNLLHANAVDEVVRCDLILGCTDSVHGRVALDELSRHYLVPVIDVGVVMDGSSGQVTEQLVNVSWFCPGELCIFCRGAINTDHMNYELMSDAERSTKEQAAADAILRGDEVDQYWRGRPRQLHTVGYLTTMAGSLMAGYVEGILTGCFQMPHVEMQFDIGHPYFGFVASPLRVRNDCNCQQHLGWAGAATPFKNVSLPPHWSQRAVRL